MDRFLKGKLLIKILRQPEMIAFDQLAPANHLVRKMEAALDFSFIYNLVENLYSNVGRTSIDLLHAQDD